MDALLILSSFAIGGLITWAMFTLSAMGWPAIRWNRSARIRMAPNASPSPSRTGFRQFLLIGQGHAAAVLAVDADGCLTITAGGVVYRGSVAQLRLLCDIWPAVLSSHHHAHPDIERPAAP